MVSKKVMEKLEIKCRYEMFVCSKNNNLFQCYVPRRDREPSRIPVKRLKRLLKKERRLTAFVFHNIRKMHHYHQKFIDMLHLNQSGTEDLKRSKKFQKCHSGLDYFQHKIASAFLLIIN